MMSSLIELFSKHQGIIAPALTAAGQYAASNLIETNLFTCPCTGLSKPFYFGIFLAAPMFIFLLFGFTINGDFWKLITNCCGKENNKCKFFFCCGFSDCCEECEGCSWKCKKDKKCCGYSALFWCGVVSYALIFPLMWAVFIIIDGDFVACAFTETPYVLKESQSCPSNVKLLNFTTDYISTKNLSQIIGWLIAAVLALISWIVYVSSSCCSKKSYYHSKIDSQCKQKLEETIVIHLEEKAANESNIKEMVENINSGNQEKVWKNYQKDFIWGDQDFTNLDMKELLIENKKKKESKYTQTTSSLARKENAENPDLAQDHVSRTCKLC